MSQRKRYLTEKEAAEFLGKKPGTLMVWRSTKRWPLAYIKIGGSVRYDEDDLIAFVESSRRENKGAPLPCA